MSLLAPELERLPHRYRLPVDAYYRLMDLGFLQGRFEILDGEVVSKMGQNPPHARILTHLNRLFSRMFGAEFIRIQVPIHIPGADGIYNEPEPDIVVTRETDASYAKRHPDPEDVVLLVEVADSTVSTDLILKARLYARAEVSEYWVLDLTDRALHVHREPANGEYSKVSVHRVGELVSLSTRLNVSFSVADLFPVD
jgi:Uncharacterized protein conserved in cyanobacteria